MKVLVCGGRDYADKRELYRVLDSYNAPNSPITCVVHGGATGADSLAGQWAKDRGVEQHVYYANWQEHGRVAGPIRNAQMLKEEPDIDLVIAFPGGRGTDNMCRLAGKQGYVVAWHGDKQ